MTDNPEPHAYVFENDIPEGASAAPLRDSVYCMGTHEGVDYYVHAGLGANSDRKQYSARIAGQDERFDSVAEVKAFISGYSFKTAQA